MARGSAASWWHKLVRGWPLDTKWQVVVRVMTLVGLGLLLAAGQLSTTGVRGALLLAALGGGLLLWGLWLQGCSTDRGGRSLFARWQFWYGTGLLLAGVAVWFLGAGVDGWQVTAVLLMALGIGQGLAEFRNTRWAFGWRGLVGLAFSGLLLAALLLIPAPPLWAVVVLLLVSVALGITAVSVLSEDVLRVWSARRGAPAPGQQRTPEPVERRVPSPGVVAAAGGVLTVLGLALLVHGPGTIGPAALVLTVGFAALLVLAASWQVEVLVAGVVAALLLFANPGATELEHQYGADPQERVVVALGDSYMSGEGAKTFFAGTNDKGVNECRRAKTAYMPQLVAEAPVLGAQDLVFLACSGAKGHELYASAQSVPENAARRAEDGLHPEDLHQLARLAQIRAVEGDLADPEAGAPQIALLVASIGGNDAGFSRIGIACVAPGDCSKGPLSRAWLTELAQVERKIDVAAHHIAAAASSGADGGFPVALVPYPIPLNATGCDTTWLSDDEHAFLYDFVVELNNAVEAAATKYGLHYVAEMETALGSGRGRDADGARLCDRDGSGEGVNFIGVMSVSGDTEHRLNPGNWVHNSFHPNELGHERMAVVMRAWLDRQSTPLATPPVPVPEPAQVRTDRTDLGEVAWAVDQTIALARHHWLEVAITAAGLYLLALALVNAYRTWRQHRQADGSRTPPDPEASTRV